VRIVLAVDQTIRVLVVDDTEDHQILIAHRLREAGIEVRAVGTGDEALGHLDNVDIVLLDYRLPGMSGLETLAAIRAKDGPSVVMVTGMGSEHIAVEAMRAGAIDYVTKDGNYLSALPQIVQRAWRTHDITRRAGELQRMALLLSSVTERETTLAAVVDGARRVLGAETCALFLTDGSGGVTQAAWSGSTVADPGDLAAAAAKAMAGPELMAPPPAPVDRLMVPLPSREGASSGVLAVVTAERRSYPDEEVDLARSFASFAGLALANLEQRELEAALVAELQETLDMRRELIMSVSHELRTPLTCITGFASTLDRLWESLNDTDRQLFVERIRHHGAELTELVDSLLDFSAAEAGRLVAHLSLVDLPAEVAAATADVGPLLTGRPLTVDVAQGVQVIADATLLRRALWNLLSNAVKYSEAGTPIAVRAFEHDGHAWIEVIDEGVGLGPQDVANAFEPFWRAKAGTARTRGSGIGLALVRDYVRLMGGEVGVRSRPGVGSTFFLSLPLAAPAN
jgi:signal transduction histidine kinase